MEEYRGMMDWPKKAYEMYQSPMSEWTDDMWDKAIEEVQK